MENKLRNLMSKVKLNKEISFYRDEEQGFVMPYATQSLIVSCKKVLLTDEIIEKLIKDKILDPEMEFEKGEIQTKPEVSKEKANTLVEKEIQTYIAWEVKNALGVEYFNDKEYALSGVNYINIHVIDAINDR